MSAIEGGGQGTSIEAVIRQMIEQYLNGIQISSAGGDSPKINEVLFLPEVADFGNVFDAAIRDAVAQHVQEGAPPVDISEEKNAQGLTEGQAVGLANNALSLMQNPEALVAAGLPKIPHAVLVTFVVSSLLPIIIHELTKPGAPFDLRFKRIMEKEFNSLMSRQTAYDFSVGERGLIVQSRTGFLNRHTGGANTNTLKMIRDGGIDKNMMLRDDYTDHAKGLF